MLRLRRRGTDPATLDDVAAITSGEALLEARSNVDLVDVTDEVLTYLLEVVRATRVLPAVELGASPRAAVHLLAAARAIAALADRSFVTPDDVARVAAPVLRHRLILRPEAQLERYSPDDAIRAAMASVTVPR